MSKRSLKVMGIAVVVILALGGVTFGVIHMAIDRSVRAYCALAREDHPDQGSDVAALIVYMSFGEHPVRRRDRAVWALGRLADPAALGALEQRYTGGRCDHGVRLCQHELTKAITRCGGTPSPPGER